jgi:hypothetical protein
MMVNPDSNNQSYFLCKLNLDIGEGLLLLEDYKSLNGILLFLID